MSSLLPPNASPQELAFEKLAAGVTEIPVPIAEAFDPLNCAESLLPWLAWAFSVNNWRSDWPVHIKRRSIQEAFSIHRRLGTPAALLDALDAVGIPVQIEEWHQQSPQGDPYTFRVLADSSATPMRQSDIRRMQDTIKSAKNLRSHLTGIVPGMTSHAESSVGAVLLHGTDMTLTAAHSDISILLVALSEGEDQTSEALDRLNHHLNTTMPVREANS